MASSATFLEEALSTDVDESAVSAIVGSFEDQLSTPTSAVLSRQQVSISSSSVADQSSTLTLSVDGDSKSNGSTATTITTTVVEGKHDIINGQSSRDTMSLILSTNSSEPPPIKSNAVTGAQHQLGNITSTVPNSSTIQGAVSSNQLQTNIGGIVQHTSGVKPTQDGLKTVFTVTQPNNVTLTSSPRLAFSPAQTVTSLPNGNLNVVTSIPMNVSTSNLQGMVSQTFAQTNNNFHKVTPSVSTEPNKATVTGSTTGAPIIIKSSVCNNGQSGTNSTSQIMTTSAVTLTGTPINTVTFSGTPINSTVTLAKPTTAGGAAPTVVANAPNVQLLSIRTTAANQTGNKTNIGSRIVLPQTQVVGARPGTPGQITLQNAQGKTLLIKTDTGYQLWQIAQPATTNSAPVGPSNAVIRVAIPPGCSVASNNSAPVSTAPSLTPSSPVVTAQRGNDNTREKCRKFLTNLLELSSKEPKAVERNVRTLIQELIDSKVEPEEFCDRLERLLNASPQPCLIGFLKKSLPLLRAAMIAAETTIEGIRPPPALMQTAPTVLLATAASTVPAQLQNNQVRPVQLGTMPQMRVVHQPNTLTTGPRTPQSIQRFTVSQPVRVQTATANATSGTTMPGMKLVTPPTMPTVATTVRIQTPLQPSSLSSTSSPSPSIVVTTAVCTTSSTISPVTTVAAQVAVAASNAAPTIPPVRLTTPVRPANAKTAPVRLQSTGSPTVRTTTTGTSSKSSSSGTKNNAVSKSAIASATSKQQSNSNQLKNSSKERDRKSATANAAAATAAATTAVTALAGGYVGEDDVNDVAAMAGVNLAEETQRILGPSEFVGTQIRSCKDETFLHTHPLTMRINEIVSKHGLDEPGSDVVALVSHAAQERLRNILEKLNVIAEHRVDFNKADKNYEISHDIRGQLRCLEELDKVERKRHDEMERELLLRAAKSRSKSEDPEQVKLKAKAKELQRAEMEELRQREANLTALQAIGPRKKIKLEDGQGSSTGTGNSNTNSGANRLSLVNRPRLKRVTLRDFLYVLEKEKHVNRSVLLYKSYLK